MNHDPAKLLTDIVRPALTFPQTLDVQSHGSIVVFSVAKKDFPVVCGSGGKNLEAIKMILAAHDVAHSAAHPTKVILTEPKIEPQRNPAKRGSTPEELAEGTLRRILAGLLEENPVEGVNGAGQVYFVCDTEYPEELRQAISRWTQVVSMANGGRRVSFVTPADLSSH